MFKFLRKIIPETSFIRLAYSWTKAILANIKYKNPSKDLRVIGITGTDGKTSTVHFTAQILENLGLKVAMSSTEEIWIAGVHNVNKTKRTTLSPFIIQNFLNEAKKKKCDVVIIEVSSHSITQGRIFGIEFDGAVVTNISQEHGNYHKDLEEYARVKSKLFQVVNSSPKKNKVLILNKEMEFYDMFSRISPEISKTYAIEDSKTNITARNLIIRENGTSFDLGRDDEYFETYLPIPGDYNVENILAASLVAEHLGFPIQKIAEKIPLCQKVQGRLDEVDIPADFKVFVDFALTPGALEKLLKYASSVAERNVILVFGCTGGNHDHEKRSIMGKVASSLADYIVITEDETYGENNEKIMKDIEIGFDKGFIAYKKISDRKEAIHFALRNACKGDIILITGMGAFQSRNNGKEEIPWNDKKEVQKYFKLKKNV